MRSLVFALLAVALLPAAAGGALFPRQRIEADYRQALASWAAGDEHRALAGLTALGAEAKEGRALVRLDRAKRAVTRSIGRRHGMALLAMARFETRAYHHFVKSGRPELAYGARRLAAELAEQHAERGGAAARDAAVLLAALGGHLHLAAQETAAAELYQRSLAIDGRQPTALLGLAALREKRGDYAGVVALLSTTEPVPGGREGSLRLGVNLLRVRQRRQGEAELQALVHGAADWVRAVAVQELGRSLAARGEVAAAGALLAAAAATLPCDPALAVQAAMLGERSGAEVPLDLASLADCADAGVSPRARYARPPAGELQASTKRVDELEPGWREALRRALGSRGE